MSSKTYNFEVSPFFSHKNDKIPKNALNVLNKDKVLNYKEL